MPGLELERFLAENRPMDGPARLFVYGTLMPGDRLWPVLAPYAQSWESGVAAGRLWDTAHGYPAVRFDPAELPIPGVVVTLHADLAAEAVEVLDEIEEEGRLYRRVQVD